MTKPALIRWVAISSLLAMPRLAAATDYYVTGTGSPGPPGNNNNAGTAAAPWATIARAVTVVQPGDTVFLRGGTYGSFNIGLRNNVAVSGTASAWITFSAYPGELPILDGGNGGGTGFGSSTSQFIRVVGIASRNFGSSGFGNGWVNDVGTSNGNWQFINCIADGNLINGITFYNASGLLIDQSIVGHNGNGSTSWSSGVNLFHVSGDFTTNVIRRTVSFENIDISTTHSTPVGGATDGSGFILDQSSSGALFENNIGFRNGGSCIRVNTPGAHMINNTCFHNGLNPNDRTPSSPGEIYFSNGLQGAVMMNNLLVASGFNDTQNAVNITAGSNNVAIDKNGASPFFMNPTGFDFHLVGSASAEIDRAAAASAPATDIGFDPRCIKAQTPQATQPAWWTSTIDYDYIRSVGGVAGCFHPATRPAGAAPDVGAYEFDGVVTSSGGASGSGGAGGATGTGGATSAGGARAAGGTSGGTGAGGARATGGAGGSSSTGAGGATGAAGTSGATGSSGTDAGAVGSDGRSVDGAGPGSGGCQCGVAAGSGASSVATAHWLAGLVAGAALMFARGRRRGRRWSGRATRAASSR